MQKIVTCKIRSIHGAPSETKNKEFSATKSQIKYVKLNHVSTIISQCFNHKFNYGPLYGKPTTKVMYVFKPNTNYQPTIINRIFKRKYKRHAIRRRTFIKSSHFQTVTIINCQNKL